MSHEIPAYQPDFSRNFFTRPNRRRALAERPGANPDNDFYLKPGQLRLLRESYLSPQELEARQNIRWQTGTQLDEMLDGGFPPGINMVYGDIGPDGNTSCGKTLLATLTAREALQKNRTVIWISPDDNTNWFSQIEPDYRHKLLLIQTVDLKSIGRILETLETKNPDHLSQSLIVIDTLDGVLCEPDSDREVGD